MLTMRSKETTRDNSKEKESEEGSSSIRKPPARVMMGEETERGRERGETEREESLDV